jgi:hypothetical protein
MSIQTDAIEVALRTKVEELEAGVEHWRAFYEETRTKAEELTREREEYRRSLRALESTVCAFPHDRGFDGRQYAIERGVPVMRVSTYRVADVLKRAEQAEARYETSHACRMHAEKALEQAEARLAEAQTEIARVVEALEWMRNLASGVGKRGEAPDDGEFEAAVDSADAALAAAREQPTQELLPLGHGYRGWFEPQMGGGGVRHVSACKLCGRPESAHQPTQEKPEGTDPELDYGTMSAEDER